MSAFVNVAAIALAGASFAAAQAPEPAPCVSLVEAVTTQGLGRLGEAVLSVTGEASAGLLASLATATIELPDEEKVTIFAPEDAAWPPAEELPTGGVLLDVLLGHVVPQYLPAAAVLEALASGEDVPLDTLAGDTVTASLIDSSIYVSALGQMAPGSEVVMTDIMTCAGVIHVINALLLPDAAAEPSMAPLAAPIPGLPAVPPLADPLAGGLVPPIGSPLAAPGPLAADSPIGVDFGDDGLAPASVTGVTGDEATSGLGVTGSDPNGASNTLAFSKSAVAGTLLAVLAAVGFAL